MNLAVFLPNWIGDAAMASPMARHLRQQFGDRGRIVAVAMPVIADVFRGTTYFDEMLIYHPKRWYGKAGLWDTARQLSRRACDAALLLPNSVRTAILARIAGIPARIGYAREGRSWLLTDRLTPPRDGLRYRPISAVDYYLEMAYMLGCPVGSKQLELATCAEDRAAVDRIWESLSLPPQGPVAVFHAGAAFGPAKQWPPEYFAALARKVAEGWGWHVLFLRGPTERQQVRAMIAMAGSPRITGLVDFEPSVGISKGCIERSRLVITTDSGPRHLAAALGKPTVTIFGSTVIDWSVNYNPYEVWLQHSLSCGPCQRRTCPLRHYRCLRDLSVDDVVRAAAELVARCRARSAA